MGLGVFWGLVCQKILGSFVFFWLGFGEEKEKKKIQDDSFFSSCEQTGWFY